MKIIPIHKIRPSDLETDITPSDTSVNLTAIPLLGPLLRHPWFIGTLHLISFALLILAITIGIFGSDRKTSLTLLLFWGIFWPLLTCITTPSIGPIFCALCPHGAMGKWLQPLGQKKSLPKWLHGAWVGMALLILGYWVLAFTSPGLLSASAHNTGWYFLAFTLLSAFFFLRYKHMAYCKHLCPLGRLLAVHGKAGGLSIRTRQNACRTCTSFECAKTCHYHLSPFNFQHQNNTENCTLCLSCLHACKEAELHWQLPGKRLTQPILRSHPQDIWVILLILAIAGIGIQLLHGLQHTGLRNTLPWNIGGLWLNHMFQIDPAHFRFSGLLALLAAIGLTLPLTLLGYRYAAKYGQHNPWSLGRDMAYALTPLAIIGLISHPVTLFATQHLHALLNETGLLFGQVWHFSPFAKRGDTWLNLFKHLPWLGIFWTLYLVWQRARPWAKTGKQHLAIWLLSSTPAWLYTGTIIVKTVSLARSG